MMRVLTRNGIALDLKKSPYSLKLGYGDSFIEFVFSSQLYKDKFEARLEDNRELFNLSMKQKTLLEFDTRILADVNLYSKIEKRGFLLIAGGEEVTCQTNLRLDGVTLTKKNLKD